MKEGYIGFDEFYWFEGGQLRKTEMKREENEKKMVKAVSLEVFERFGKGEGGFGSNDDEDGVYKGISDRKKKGQSLESSLKRVPKSRNKNIAKAPKSSIPKEIKFVNSKKQIAQDNY